MNTFKTIVRGIPAVVTAVVYLVMSFASVTHEISHWAERSASHSASSALHQDLAQSSMQAADAHHTAPLKSIADFCFFCAHSPTLLLVLATVLLIGLLVTRPVYASTIHKKPSVALIFSANSLRAPPVVIG